MYGKQKDEFTSDRNLLVVSVVVLGTLFPSSIFSSLRKRIQKQIKRKMLNNFIKTVPFEANDYLLPFSRTVIILLLIQNILPFLIG